MFGPKHNVSEIVATFSKTITRLRAASEYHMDQASICHTEAEELRDRADAHINDRRRATAIADKLGELIEAS